MLHHMRRLLPLPAHRPSCYQSRGWTKSSPSARDAVADIPSGATNRRGGVWTLRHFGAVHRGPPRHRSRDLTVVSNNCGVDDFGLGLLLASKQIKKMIASYVGENKEFERQFLGKELDVELVPQGTLAERLRAGGAGFRPFIPRVGSTRRWPQGKEEREFDGRRYILERGITADFALVKAWKGERFGNLIYRLTARNSNPVCATAGRVTVAEVEELVEPGDLDPNEIHTPGVFVQRVVHGTHEKRIERRTVRALEKA